MRAAKTGGQVPRSKHKRSMMYLLQRELCDSTVCPLGSTRSPISRRQSGRREGKSKPDQSNRQDPILGNEKGGESKAVVTSRNFSQNQ
jgi:hypothetical protein